jgi:hypothetical protein
VNIFILDEEPERAARDQCDKHVIKMCLETAQIMSTVLGGPYRPTHKHHPCVVWAGNNTDNMYWLYYHGLSLCMEYTRRYGRTHKCEEVIRTLGNKIEDVLPRGCGTEFVQCMPEQFRGQDPVTAYRKYYHSKPFTEWKHSDPPAWWRDPEYV